MYKPSKSITHLQGAALVAVRIHVAHRLCCGLKFLK